MERVELELHGFVTIVKKKTLKHINLIFNKFFFEMLKLIINLTFK